MNVSIIGTGYVGLVTGTCLSETGHNVTCIDINKNKIEKLNKGIIPIYEPKLENLILKNIKEDKLYFSNNYDSIINSEVIFIAVGTPCNEAGLVDLTHVLNAVSEISKLIKKRTVVVIKSTVSPGTCEKIKNIIYKELKIRKLKIDIDVVSNPEFLKEGSAVDDFMNPDRIIIGCEEGYPKIVMESLYKMFPANKLIFTSIVSAEMIKYASNAMLATRISFINEIANLCETVGANVLEVAKGIGYDNRIGNKFLDAGCGYGGSCFPKDVKALIKIGDDNNVNMNIIKATEKTNNEQKHILYKKLCKTSKQVNYQIKNIAILGAAFKPNTDDMREAISIVLINDLLEDKLNIGPFDKIKIYDPIALNECKQIIGVNEKIEYCKEIDNAIIDTDAIIIVTEWKQIKELSLNIIKKLMKGNIIIDGRNIFNKYDMNNEFIYEGIGT